MSKEKRVLLENLLQELLAIPPEERELKIIEEINNISPDPSWSDYIYYSEDFVKDGEIDVKLLVEKMLGYTPFS